jgi:hypothetical protein
MDISLFLHSSPGLALQPGICLLSSHHSRTTPPFLCIHNTFHFLLLDAYGHPFSAWSAIKSLMEDQGVFLMMLHLPWSPGLALLICLWSFFLPWADPSLMWEAANLTTIPPPGLFVNLWDYISAQYRAFHPIIYRIIKSRIFSKYALNWQKKGANS